MKFKKLEVYGFKSFGDKLEIKFSSGITAIVGPNGCGKSNVADSIRWVLGEQSAKLLRGSSMQDVIFNGTENRKALSYCEVSLYFDNSEKLFPNVAYDEVVISRKLFRSNESEYLINKTTCKRSDIIDLLREGGMGREGYSIIGQGRIDELLTSKPEDRRTIFEEAAGISKYKAKKKESESKLARTRDNILRIEDTLNVKFTILEPLRKQSESAIKWKELRERLKILEVNKYIYKYESVNQAKEAIDKRLTEVNNSIAKQQAEYESLTKKYNVTVSDLNSIDSKISQHKDEYLELNVALERQNGEVMVLKERISFFESQNKVLDEENAQLSSGYQQTTQLIEQGNATISAEKKSLELAHSEVEELNEKYLSVSSMITAGQDEVQVSYNSALTASEKLAEIKSNMSRLIAERDGLISASEGIQKRIDSLTIKINDGNKKQSQLTSELSDLDNQLHTHQDKLSKQLADNAELNSKINECILELNKLSNEYHTATGRRKLLREIHESYDGFAFSVKKLINDSKTNQQVAGKIEGLVAQIIRVGKGFETAIEMALGGAVQNIVTKNEDDAKYLIAYLKQMRYGRATFLPMTSVKPREISGLLLHSLKIDGCYGVASDIVSYDKKYDNVVRSLLGSTVIVENIDVAVALAKRTGYAFRIVTKEGDIIAPQGSITGGSKKSDSSNIFAHERELNELNVYIEKLSHKQASLNENKTTLLNSKSENESLVDAFNAKINTISTQITAKQEFLAELEQEIASNQQELSLYENEMLAKHNRIFQIEADIDSVEELENIESTNKLSVSASTNTTWQKFESLRVQQNDLSQSITDLKLQISTKENFIQTTQLEIERLEKNLLDFTSRVEQKKKQIAANESEIRNLNNKISEVIENSTDYNAEKIKQLKSLLLKLEENKLTLNTTIAEIETKRQETMEVIQNLMDKRNQEELLLQKVDSDIEAMRERIIEQYSLEYADCLPLRDSNFDIEAGSVEINKLMRQISALGNINVDAIEQYEEYSKEYNDYKLKHDDLLKAEADLLEIIKGFTDEMLKIFSTEFEKIRTNYIRIFKELFAGGNADLVLLENDNPLEAGIDIIANPPQKRVNSIMQLSGGEKALTAIAILFAILQLKPMPFCVLDEIEAALDDANAKRFAAYLQRYSDNTQFIVITHRKPTMEQADNLYGVTMEEKGVSKIVSVKLKDALEAQDAIDAQEAKKALKAN